MFCLGPIWNSAIFYVARLKTLQGSARRRRKRTSMISILLWVSLVCRWRCWMRQGRGKMQSLGRMWSPVIGIYPYPKLIFATCAAVLSPWPNEDACMRSGLCSYVYNTIHYNLLCPLNMRLFCVINWPQIRTVETSTIWHPEFSRKGGIFTVWVYRIFIALSGLSFAWTI